MAAKLLNLAKVAADIQALMKQAGQKNRTRFRNAVLKPLIECGLLEATIPDKAQSSKQKYRLTAMGRAILEKGTTGTPKQGRDEPPSSNRGGPSHG